MMQNGQAQTMARSTPKKAVFPGESAGGRVLTEEGDCQPLGGRSMLGPRFTKDIREIPFLKGRPYRVAAKRGPTEVNEGEKAEEQTRATIISFKERGGPE